MTDASFDRPALAALLRERALKFGSFTLASGKQASYYLDCKQVTLHSRGARLLAAGLFSRIAGDDSIQAVGGMSIGADPIVGAVLAVAAEARRDLLGFLVRKEPKGHGTQRYLEGPVAAGHRAVIVEDVVTTGGSALMALERAREFGLVVDRVLCLVDRLEGGAETFAKHGATLESLFTIRDFGIEPPSV